MHSGLLYLTADTTGLAKLGACSHLYCRSYQINVGVLPFLERISSFGPVVIEGEADLSVFLPIFSSHMDGHLLPKALKYFGHGDLVFSRQGLSKRTLEDILDAIELSPVVCKAVVVLYAAINAAVQAYDLLCIQECPSRFWRRFAFCGAETPLTQSLDELG